MDPTQTGTLSRLDPVEKLRGCGRKTANKLQYLGIRNCGELIDAKFTTPNPVFVRLQTTARNLVSIQPETLPIEKKNAHYLSEEGFLVIECHSWKGLNCHTIRKGSLVRVEIGPLIVKLHRISLCLQLVKGGITRRRYAHPSVLLLLQNMWLLDELTSETSDLESNDPISSVLPKFTIDFDQLENQRGMTVHISTELKSLVREVYATLLFLGQ